MATYDFSVRKGDTWNGIQLQIRFNADYSSLSAFPAIGQTGMTYTAIDTGIKYIWNGVAYVVTATAIYLDLTGATFLCQFKPDVYSLPVLTLTELSGITVTSAINGAFTINPIIFDMDWGTYVYDIQITQLSGIIKTYISGALTLTTEVSYV